MSYRFCWQLASSQAFSKTCIFYSKNKFEKLVLLFSFIIRICYWLLHPSLHNASCSFIILRLQKGVSWIDNVYRSYNSALHAPARLLSFPSSRPNKLLTLSGTARLKRDGTRAETRFGLSAKRTSPFKLAGEGGGVVVSVQSTTGSRVVRLSSSNGSNAGYTMFWGRVQDYWLHTPLACFPFTSPTVLTVCRQASTELYVKPFELSGTESRAVRKENLRQTVDTWSLESPLSSGNPSVTCVQ